MPSHGIAILREKQRYFRESFANSMFNLRRAYAKVEDRSRSRINSKFKLILRSLVGLVVPK